MSVKPAVVHNEIYGVNLQHQYTDNMRTIVQKMQVFTDNICTIVNSIYNNILAMAHL